MNTRPRRTRRRITRRKPKRRRTLKLTSLPPVGLDPFVIIDRLLSAALGTKPTRPWSELVIVFLDDVHTGAPTPEEIKTLAKGSDGVYR